MRSLLVGLVLLAHVPSALADDAVPQSAARAAIDRGLVFLVKDAQAWRDEHHCASCHHASLIVMAMREARQGGHAVDEPMFTELAHWMAESGEGKTGVPRPPDRPKALNTKALYYALALGTDPQPDEISLKGLRLLTKTVVEDQIENGSWVAWTDTRPPFFGGSGEAMTALATLSLMPVVAIGDEAAVKARDKGVEWLAGTKSDDDSQSIALRLLIWQRAGRPAAEWAPLVERIRQRQNADGGWSQAADMASDAWATGQALYALASTGLKSDDPAIHRGRAFLVATQRPDGSWPMTSRPTKPGGAGSNSLIPITGAGSAWAVLGLARSR